MNKKIVVLTEMTQQMVGRVELAACQLVPWLVTDALKLPLTGQVSKRSFPDTDAANPFQHISSVQGVRYCRLVIQNAVNPCRQEVFDQLLSPHACQYPTCG